MGIRYYKLFDLLNRRGMKKSDLRQILSPKTVSKLSKGEYLSGEAIEKICIFLNCQPGDIMEIVKEDPIDDDSQIITVAHDIPNSPGITRVETYGEFKEPFMTFAEADEEGATKRQFLGDNIS